MDNPTAVEDIFLAALKKVSADTRAAYLEQACHGDPELRRRVERLLAAHPSAGSFLEQPAVQLPETTDSQHAPKSPPAGAVSNDIQQQIEATEQIGQRIGPYELLQKLGDGGMGTVWVAEQERPVKRRVAIKLIKPGMDSAQVVRRFEAERQALALMDHTNIAKVLDAGTTPRGRPFFVMELVKGVPITKYCDELHLPIRDRLELFMSVCQAIQHAHQKGIIHRDIKPSNVLVCMQDGNPVPKVIDFGIAKALHQKLADRTMYTEIGAIVGTLEYMAPEQAELSALDIDTRADVYALGVLLYELLTGTTPFDRTRLGNAALGEVLRIIREVDPPKPSTRLTQSKESLASLAAQRRTEPTKLSKIVRGELDWLVMKCLEKDRTRRYESASNLARDVERYLGDEAVEACPPSAGYRFRKFVRRNRLQVAAACLVLLTLSVGIAGTTFGLVQAERARRDEAEQRRIAQENESKAIAAAKAEVEQRAHAVRARDRAREALDAMTSSAIGDSLRTQQKISEDQKKFLTEVLTYYREFAGENAEDEQSRARTAAAAFRVGVIETRLGRNQQGLAAYDSARDAYAALTADFPHVPEYRTELGRTHGSLGSLLQELGKHAQAEEHFRAAMTIREKLVAEFPADPDPLAALSRTHQNLGNMLAVQGRRAEAEPHLRKAIALQQDLAANHPTVHSHRIELANSHTNLATLLRDLAQLSEAEEQFRHALDIRQKLITELPGSPATRAALASTHNNLAMLLDDLGRLPDVEQHGAKAVTILESLADEFPAAPEYRHSLVSSHINLGAMLINAGKLSDAEARFRLALPIAEQLAAEFPTVPTHRYGLAVLHSNLGLVEGQLLKLSEAEEQLRKSLAVLERLVADFPTVPAFRQALAGGHTNLGNLLGPRNPQQAEQHHLTALGMSEKLVADFPDALEHQVHLGGGYCNYGNLAQAGGRPGESLDWYAKAIRVLSAVYEQDRRLTLARQFLLKSYTGRASVRKLLKRYADEAADWDKIIELSPPPAPPALRVARAHARVRAGQIAEAVAEIAQLTQSSNASAEHWYNCACIYAAAANGSAHDKQELADRAMQLLMQAQSAGWKNAALMKNDPDLDSLRERADFKKLIAELESSE